MRFEELVLRIPGDEFRIRFHDNLTVLCGISMLERQALADSILGAVTGGSESTVLHYTDNTGRPVEVVSSAGRARSTYLDDGSPAAPLVGSVAPDVEALRTLMLVQAGDLGLTVARPRDGEPAELTEARAMLAELTERLQATMSARRTVETARAELGDIEARLRQAEDSTARREYARVLADLERVRSEAAALQSGRTGVENDRHLVDSAGKARTLASAWMAAAERVVELAAGWDAGERFEADTAAAYALVPDTAPTELEALRAAWTAAVRERDYLDGRVRELAASRLPDPSDPRVVHLAALDQKALWAARDRVLEATRQLEREQIALGGVSPRGAAAHVIDAIETSHSRVEDAEAVLRSRWVPAIAGSSIAAVGSIATAALLPAVALPALAVAVAVAGFGLGLPYRTLRTARRHELGALSEADAPTYLSFHLRRVDAAIDPALRERLELAALDHRMAVTAWDDLAKGVGVETAAALEAEVLAYAAALSTLGGAADEIESLRSDLATRVEPALAAARQALLEACAPYGLDEQAVTVDDGTLIERLVDQQVALGRRARLQVLIEEAESAEQALAARLDDLLVQLGFVEGDLEARIGALEWSVARAEEREQARAKARDREAIEDDLVRLQAEARRLRRPEWASVTPRDAEGPDVDALQARKTELLAALSSVPTDPDEIDRLVDRHSAMERRVAALESRGAGGHGESAVAQLADVHQYLLAHLAKAAHAGAHDESLPVLLDEPFLRIPAERKWELLDMLRRLGEKTQLIYFTDDPFVAAWARRRAADGAITLLEPIAEPV